MKSLRILLPAASLGLSGIAFAWCCFATSVLYFPESCINRVWWGSSPAYRHTCDPVTYTLIGCSAPFTATATNYKKDYTACPGTGCSGCTPITTVLGTFSYTDYSDKPC